MRQVVPPSPEHVGVELRGEFRVGDLLEGAEPSVGRIVYEDVDAAECLDHPLDGCRAISRQWSGTRSRRTYARPSATASRRTASSISSAGAAA
jgi:hypothetical protein